MKNNLKTINNNKKAKSKSNQLIKNVAIFLSAFCVLYLFFILTFGGNFTSGSKTTFYALTEGSYYNAEEAYTKAEKIKLLGGSGNIWCSGDKYNVIAFVYNNADSAREVQNRLQEEDLSLRLSKMEIKTTNLGEEEKLLVNSLLSISERIYEIMANSPQSSSEMQTDILIGEVKKSAITAIARAEVLLSDKESVANATIAGELVMDAFNEATSKSVTTSQNLGWLRSQILIYAYEFAKKY